MSHAARPQESCIKSVIETIGFKLEIAKKRVLFKVTAQ